MTLVLFRNKETKILLDPPPQKRRMDTNGCDMTTRIRVYSDRTRERQIDGDSIV